ncbi:MAG: cell division protein Fic [Patescibacteria group bacterium]|nr:MAG: cell division protein Fic [Patescibacteria group bacterium]
MYKPVYLITNSILVSISKIEAAEEVIKNAPLLPLWEKQFKDDAVLRAVYHGTHLEGNPLSKDEAEDVLTGKQVVARSRDIQEIINYRNVLDFVDQEAKKGIKRITEQIIKKIHRILVDKTLPVEQSGEYRDKQVVVRDIQTGEVVFKPPAALEVPYLMREFVYWLNYTDPNSIHPVIKAGISHYELVRIHPFFDGNGRTARVLATLILFLGGYDIRRFFSLEEYYDRDAVSYYESLRKAQAGDLTPWLEYFCYGASVEFQRIKNKVLKLSKDVKLKSKFGGKQLFLNERQIKIMEHIQDVGFLQNKMFASLFPDLSEDTVLREVKDLIDKGVLKKIGRTKSARYVLND